MSEEEPNAGAVGVDSGRRPTRERKQVERIVVETVQKVKTATSIPDGTGIAMSDYPYFLNCFEKVKTDDEVCKMLHQLMFNSMGTKNDRKKSIRKFCGFAEEANMDSKIGNVIKKKQLTNPLLKDCLGLFGLERSGTRDQLVNRLMNYLQCPHKAKRDGTRAPSAGKKRKLSKKSRSGGEKSKRGPSAFMLFSQANRDQAKENNPGASFGEIGKALGEMWHALSADEKEEWKNKASTASKLLSSSDGGEDDDAALDFSEEEEDADSSAGEEDGADAEENEGDSNTAEEE